MTHTHRHYALGWCFLAALPVWALIAWGPA